MATEKRLYRFTINYYFCRYHTGYVDETQKRTAIVTASNKAEAIAKIVQADDDFICVAGLNFEEVKVDSDGN